jgi:hypothetical protein
MGVVAAAALLPLTSCLSMEEWDMVAEDMAANRACPNCNWDQHQQIIRQNRLATNPQSIANEENERLAGLRTNYSEPDTLICKIPNYSPSIPTWHEEVRVSGGEWYFGPVGRATQRGNCNSAYVDNQGYVVSVTCTLRRGMLQRTTSAKRAGGGWGASQTINTYSGVWISTSYGDHVPYSERRGECAYRSQND